MKKKTKQNPVKTRANNKTGQLQIQQKKKKRVRKKGQGVAVLLVCADNIIVTRIAKKK